MNANIHLFSVSSREAELPQTGNQLTKMEKLRQKAEMLLKTMPKKTRAQIAELETLNLINEISAHQLELEIQNEELNQACSAAQIAAEKYADLYDFAPSGYFTLNRAGEITELNLRASQMLGVNRKRLINCKFDDFISEDSLLVYRRFLENIFSSSNRESCEVMFGTAGHPVLDIHLSGVATDDGLSCLINAVDTTEIQLKNAELQKINAEKDKFFSIIAHDLRSPFNGFLGLTEIMDEGLADMTPEEIKKIVSTLRNSAANLFRLLGNLLEWSRMQRGLSSLKPSLFLLSAKIPECIDMAAASRKDIKIGYNIPDNLIVSADENMLECIIRNLVSNAIKFTPKGGEIVIAAQPVFNNSVEVSVSDTGIGIPREMLRFLFDLNGNTRRKGTEGECSTGLGLILCKDFVEKHGGHLLVESEEGKGSVFRFVLPVDNRVPVNDY